MTTVTGGFCDDRLYLEISGHACPGDGDAYRMPAPDSPCFDGENSIACAAISILVISAAETLRRLESEGMFRSSDMTVDDGYACFDIELDPDFSERVRDILSPVMTGFELLEENYPELIRVS